MMKNDTSVSMTFQNKVTGLRKLERYETRLKSLKQVMETMPNSVVMNSKPIDNIGKSINSTNETTKSLNNALNKTKVLLSKGFNAIGIVALGRGLKNAFNNMQKYIDASSSYVENLNLMQVAFKETGKANDRFNESFVNGLADMFGLDESTMTRQLGFYRQIGNALNVDSKYADLLSKNLLKMQLDMSSLYNLSFEKSGEVIQSSIAGQTKPVRGATGADITQATLQTTLDDLGIDRAISDLSRGEKVLTIYLSLVNQLSESQGDLAKTINSVANQEKIFTEQTARMSRMVGNVLSVSFQKALPYLNAFLMVINELIEKFAIFVGFELPTYEQSTGGYDLSDYLDDISDSADKAKKKLSGLRSFDRLNVINTPKDTSKGISGVGGIDQRLLDALKDYDLKLSDIDNKATKIRDKVMEWLGFTKEVNSETGEITWKYDTLGKSAQQIAREVGTNLGKALTEETTKLKWEEYGQKLANGVNITLGFVNSFVDNYDWFALGQEFAKGINTSLDEVDWNDVGKAFTNKFKIMISTASGFLQTLDYKALGKSIGDFINGAIGNIPAKDLTNGINAFAKGLLTAFVETIKTLDWGQIASTTVDIIFGLDWSSWLLIGGVVFKKKIATSFTKLFADAFKSVKFDFKSFSTNFAVFTETAKATGETGLKAFSTGMQNAWKETSKFTKVLVGATGVITGLNLTNDAMKSMTQNGITVGNTFETMGGILATTLGGFAAGGLVGATLGAVAGTVGTIVQLVSAGKQSLDEMNDALETAEKDSQLVYEKLYTNQVTFASIQEEINDKIKGSLDNLNYAEGAVNNLEKLIDANGKIVGSTEEVQLQLDLLNESLGTEYKITGDTITLNGKKVASYDELKDGVQNYIDKMKAEIYLEAYKEKAIEATKRIIELQKVQAYNQERINARIEKINTLQSELNELTNKYGGNVDAIKGKDKERYDSLKLNLDSTRREYDLFQQQLDKNNQEIETWQQVIDNYTEASALNAAGKTEEAINVITGVEKKATKEVSTFTDKTVDDLGEKLKKANLKTIIDVALNKKDATINIKADTTSANKTITKFLDKLKVGTSSFVGLAGLLKSDGGIYQNGVWSNIPKYATGGLPPVGQVFVANEKGAELISHIGGKTYVENRNQIMDLIDSKISRATSRNNQPMNLTLPIYLGSTQIAKVVLNDIQDMASANGKEIRLG